MTFQGPIRLAGLRETVDRVRGNILRLLGPESPFVWPEPDVSDERAAYDTNPPFEALVRMAKGLFGQSALPMPRA